MQVEIFTDVTILKQQPPPNSIVPIRRFLWRYRLEAFRQLQYKEFKTLWAQMLNWDRDLELIILGRTSEADARKCQSLFTSRELKIQTHQLEVEMVKFLLSSRDLDGYLLGIKKYYPNFTTLPALAIATPQTTTALQVTEFAPKPIKQTAEDRRFLRSIRAALDSPSPEAIE